ncbi:phage tail terminator protein [Phocoenobacter skyensis]|uniref:Phage protein n=1 Tax=Phocoenobacter skyensis TaxID=97481 RepID=A0ABT9JKQ2_9PAST|nr:hypothetical protein [Pasteurella skyensis]MDP8079518.1 hypothetical protein [Pasteurella skyensis]MDP8085390.1 hypothetical protein [Pasteurella skyensis]
MNYLFAGEKIVKRLKEVVPEFKEVLKAGELALIHQKSQQSPTAYVIYQGDVINANTPANGTLGKAQYVKQQWLVVVVVNMSDKRHIYNDTDELAGELIDKTLKALMGYVLDKQCKPLTRSAKSIKAEYIDGFGYFPFIFDVNFIHKA